MSTRSSLTGTIQYRGYDWEKYDDFCQRMLQKHPAAELLQSPEEPNDTIKYGSQPYVHCLPVTPEPDKTSPIFTNLNVPPQIRAYYEHKSVILLNFVIKCRASLINSLTATSTPSASLVPSSEDTLAEHKKCGLKRHTTQPSSYSLQSSVAPKSSIWSPSSFPPSIALCSR